jgi:hypothetical protein
MKNGFKSKYGFMTIIGIHCLPIWLYILKNYSLNILLQLIVLNLLLVGRLMGLYVELWIILKNIQRMIEKD